jgi:hypothetical protein
MIRGSLVTFHYIPLISSSTKILVCAVADRMAEQQEINILLEH